MRARVAGAGLVLLLSGAGCFRGEWGRWHPGEKIDADEVVVVGRVVFRPPLRPEAYAPGGRSHTASSWPVMVLFSFSDKPLDLERINNFAGQDEFAGVAPDTFFANRIERRPGPLFVRAVQVFTGEESEHSWFTGTTITQYFGYCEGRAQTEIRPEDHVVYVGTLICERPEGQTPRLRVYDEYDALTGHWAKIAGGPPLRRAARDLNR